MRGASCRAWPTWNAVLPHAPACLLHCLHRTVKHIPCLAAPLPPPTVSRAADVHVVQRGQVVAPVECRAAALPLVVSRHQQVGMVWRLHMGCGRGREMQRSVLVDH